MKNQKKIGVLLSYATEIVKILTTLLYTPVMLKILGDSEYGLYQLVHSVVAYLGLLSLGFGSAYIRFYSRYKAKNDETEIARLNGMFMTIFSIISLICLASGSVMVLNVESIFATGLTAAEVDKARILMGLMVINLALTFPNTVFNNCITAHEKFFFQKLILLLQAVFNPFITLPLLLMGYGSVGMVLVTTGLTVGVLISNAFFCFKKIKIKFIFKGFKLSMFKEMFVFTFFLFINQIIDQINWSVDKYLLGRIIGTTTVAVYSVGAQLNALYIQMSTSISNVFVPQVNRIVADDDDNNKLSKLLTKVGRLQFFVLALIMSGIVFFGRSFIGIWIHKPGYESAYYVALLLIVPETVPLIQNIGIEIQRAKNKHKVRSIVYLFMSIANIFISIPLINRFGEIGAAAGTTISLVVCNIGFMNWYYKEKIGLNILSFWKSIISMGKGLILPLMVGTAILIFVNTTKIYSFIPWVAFYSIVYFASMWFLGMNKEEKELVFSVVHNIKRRISKKKSVD